MPESQGFYFTLFASPLQTTSAGTFSKPSSAGGRRWTISIGTCAIVGVFPGLAATERVFMSTIPQRIATTFAVLFGRYGDVSRMAQDREQSRQSLYREADDVVDALDGTATQSRIDQL